MKSTAAIALALLLAFAIVTVWVPARWPLSLLQCGVFLLALAWAMSLLLRPRPLRLSPLLIPLAAAVLIALLQLVFDSTVYRHDTLDSILVWTANLAVFFLALQFDRALLDRLLPLAAGFGCAVAIAAMLHPPAGPFPNRNHFAALIELLLPIALTLALRRRAYAILAAIMYAAVIATASRAGAVLVTAEVVFVLLAARRRRKLQPRVVVAALALCALFTAAAGWTLLFGRWTEPAGFQIRRDLALSSFAMIRDRPLTGFGLGAWSTAYPAYARYDDGSFVNQAHDDWLQFTAEGGLPMLLVLLSIAAATLRPALRHLWPIGLLALLLHAFVDYPLQKPALEALFFTLLGLIGDAA